MLHPESINVLKTHLANIEDDLYRYKTFLNPSSFDGNGRLVADIIHALENDRNAIKGDLQKAGVKI